LVIRERGIRHGELQTAECRSERHGYANRLHWWGIDWSGGRLIAGDVNRVRTQPALDPADANDEITIDVLTRHDLCRAGRFIRHPDGLLRQIGMEDRIVQRDLEKSRWSQGERNDQQSDPEQDHEQQE
jgi:hypothetical protein